MINGLSWKVFGIRSQSLFRQIKEERLKPVVKSVVFVYTAIRKVNVTMLLLKVNQPAEYVGVI